jgi:hypothetical protein
MPISYEKIKARKEIDPEYAAKQKGYAVEYRERNLEKERERQRLSKQRTRDKDRDGYNAKMREYNKENVYPKQALEVEERKKNNPDYDERAHTIKHLSRSDYWRHWKMKSKYGIGLFDYRKMYANQSGKCAICNDEKSDYGKNGLVIDHCHSKGHIRELLCGKCNTGLGHFNDDINRLTNAMEYLIKHTKEI